MLLLRLIFLFLSFLIVDIATAMPIASCVELGTHPSFIIKLKNNPADLLQNTQLSTTWLHQLSDVSQLQFTDSRTMAWGAYIIFFNAPDPQQACYPIEQIKHEVDLIMHDPNVEFAIPNQIMHLMQAKEPVDGIALDATQWDMNTTNLGGIDAIDAWNTTQGQSVVLADLDTGILDNGSLNPNVLSGVSFINNGTWRTGAAPSCTIADCGMNAAGHGTHTAGIMVASGTYAYDQNIYGVAPAAKVLPINVFTRSTGGSCSMTACLTGYTSDYMNAMSWLKGQTFSGLPSAPEVVAFNMSFVSNYSCSWSYGLKTVFAALVAAGIVPVASAGNSRADTAYYTPASCPGVIAVAATGPTHLRADYSNYGSTVAVSAPGGDYRLRTTESDQIYSTVYQGYKWLQGTSMAAPHVTGLIALLYARDPTMLPEQVLSIIKNTATPFASTTDATRSCASPTTCGAGIIDAAAAVAAITPPTLNWIPNFVTTPLNANSEQISWTAAQWSNSATTRIHYSVTLDGNAVSTCQNMTAATCVISNLTSNQSVHAFTVAATDYRRIFTPVVQSGTFGTALVPPVLTSALRNQSLLSEIWLAYSNLGSDIEGNHYSVTGLPPEVTITLDRSNQRFVLENVGYQLMLGVGVTVSYSNFDAVTSNKISIPSTEFQPPMLSGAERNPNSSTEVWLSYDYLGTDFSDNTYVIKGVPANVTITLDKANQRFILENVGSSRITGVYVMVQNPNFASVVSNQITIDNVGFLAPVLTFAARNLVLPTTGWIYYSELGADYPENVYTLVGFPENATVTLDRANNRFVIENITTPRAAQVSIQLSNSTFGTVSTEPLRFPSIAG